MGAVETGGALAPPKTCYTHKWLCESMHLSLSFPLCKMGLIVQPPS